MIRTSTIVAAAAVSTIAATAPAQTTAPMSREVYLTGLSFPLEMVQHPNDPTIQFVVQQNGIIRVVQNGVLGTTFASLSSVIGSTANEQGLLGLAFDPNYGLEGAPNSDVLYVSHTNTLGGNASNVARYQHMPGNPFQIDTSTREVLLTVSQPFSNHNGGHIEMGPDGMLYIGMGDGGLSNDPFENAQNINSQLGKILRIDVSGGAGSGFSVPANNPFVGVAGDDLIWSWGIRNPWKFTFDTGACGTDAMLIGDVGQDAREEINYEPAGASGRNYGWDCREGNLCLTNDVGCDCNDPTLVDPIHVVNQPTAQSITGGYVYRGASMPANRGRYFFGDFATGRTWSLGLDIDQDGEATVTDVVDHTTELGGPVNISSYARDANGELYIISYFQGTIYRIVGDLPSADTNLDGDVNGTDLANLLAQWLDTSCGVADLNNDQIVNGADLAELLAQWSN